MDSAGCVYILMHIDKAIKRETIKFESMGEGNTGIVEEGKVEESIIIFSLFKIFCFRGKIQIQSNFTHINYFFFFA